MGFVMGLKGGFPFNFKVRRFLLGFRCELVALPNLMASPVCSEVFSAHSLLDHDESTKS